MSALERIRQARESGDLQSVIEQIPYARLLGVQCRRLGEELLFVMPRKPDNQGNPSLPAIHGGVIGGFMEMSALLHVLFTTSSLSALPRVVDFSIDYLRAGKMTETYAECSVVRQGRKIVNVSITAWQTTRDKPIATARVHFLLPA